MDMAYKDSKTSLYIFICEFTLLGPNYFFFLNFHSIAWCMYATSNFSSMKDSVPDEHSSLKMACLI